MPQGEIPVMSIANANRHTDLSRRLMEQANYELHTMADRVQASDKASGAVAQAVKAIAEDRELAAPLAQLAPGHRWLAGRRVPATANQVSASHRRPAAPQLL